MTIGEFGRDRLAQQYAPGGARQSCGAGIARGSAAGVNRRAVSRRHIGGVENVLDAEWHAPEQSVSPRLVSFVRPGQRRLWGEVTPGAHHRLAFGMKAPQGPTVVEYLATMGRQAHVGIAAAYLPAPQRSAITGSARSQ